MWCGVFSTFSILGEEVKVEEGYRYLAVHLVNRLDWEYNTEAVYRKGQNRLCFLRKLRSFNVCSKMLHIFYESVVASEIFFAAICWGSSIRASDTEQADKVGWICAGDCSGAPTVGWSPKDVVKT